MNSLTCEICAQPFMARTCNTKTCSKACQLELNRRRCRLWVRANLTYHRKMNREGMHAKRWAARGVLPPRPPTPGMGRPRIADSLSAIDSAGAGD
jgi:hypothetical protein